MSSVESRIKACVEQLFRELDLLLQQRTLESLRALLEGAAVPARRARQRVRVARAGGGSPEDLRDRVLARIRSSPGETVEEIARAVGGSPAAVKRVIQVLLAAKQIRRTGARTFAGGARQLARAVASSSRQPRTRRRGRKARRSKRSPRKTRKTAKPGKQRRAHRPKKRAAPRSPGKVVVPRRRRRPAATRPPEAIPAAESVEATQPELEFLE